MSRALILLLALAGRLPSGEVGDIASFSPAATRILTDLGCGHRLMAVTRWCELPAGNRAERVCDAFEPELERLLILKPRLVVIPRLANPLLAERLRASGLRVHVLEPESPESPAKDVQALGTLTGKAREAALLNAALRPMREPDGRRVLILWDGVMAGPESYLAGVMASAGLQPALRRGRWLEWDPEVAALGNPDLVLYLSTSAGTVPKVSLTRLNEWKRRPALSSTNCASEGYIFEVHPGSLWLPGSGLAEAARILADLAEAHK
jgi:ABC-type Fe3+-hydroxamate transport system substrate-binding protein